MFASDHSQTRIGAAVLVILFAGVFYTVAFSDRSYVDTIGVRIHFGHMASLEEGADVHLAGRAIGKLRSLELVPADSLETDHPLFPEGGVTAHLRLDGNYASRAKINGDYFVGSKGLFGKSYIEIGPPMNAPPGRSIRSGDDIRGIDPPILDRAVYNAMRNFAAFREFVSEIEPEIDRLRHEIDELDRQLGEILPTANSWDTLMADSRTGAGELDKLLDGAGDLSKVEKLIHRARLTLDDATTRAAQIATGLQLLDRELERVGAASPAKLARRFRTAIDRFQASARRLESTLAVANELAAMLERGEGTTGALLNDPEFSDDARRLGKILKRTPWRIFTRPGNKAPKFGKPPEPPDL